MFLTKYMSLLNQNFADDDAIEMSDDGMEDDDNDDSSGDGDLVKIKPSTQGWRGTTAAGSSFAEKPANVPAAPVRNMLASWFNPTALSQFEFVHNDEETCVLLYMMNTHTSSATWSHML